MLAHDPKDRLSLYEIINHSWTKQEGLSNTDLFNQLQGETEYHIDCVTLSGGDENSEALNSPDVIPTTNSDDSVSSVLSDEEVKFIPESPPNLKELLIRNPDPTTHA